MASLFLIRCLNILETICDITDQKKKRKKKKKTWHDTVDIMLEAILLCHSSL